MFYFIVIGLFVRNGSVHIKNISLLLVPGYTTAMDVYSSCADGILIDYGKLKE
jgi:hypothetical protein